MAQSEDTELRDLVIEALDKNGSLAKIRALLRANVFLAFENECENIKQNVCLDNILKIPEGIIALSLVHEFLEFCNLKNTLFVYMAESRQKKEYVYEGQKALADKLNLQKRDTVKEPILISILKNVMKHSPRKYVDDNNQKDDENCTYIVHDDSGTTTSNSQSDTSSDEKNKLHLRLNLENSDTDTSSDSTRDKSSSEYIPSEHIIAETDKTKVEKNNTFNLPSHNTEKELSKNTTITNPSKSAVVRDTNAVNIINSSDSTSYKELKSLNIEPNVIRTSEMPNLGDGDKSTARSMIDPVQLVAAAVSQDPVSPATLSSISSITSKDDKDVIKAKPDKNSTDKSPITDVDAEYSLDFSLSSHNKNESVVDVSPSDNMNQDISEPKSPVRNKSNDSQHSPSSQSSVSISDVADLISEKSYSLGNRLIKSNYSSNSKKPDNNSRKDNVDNNVSDDSGDFSESPIPSLSNLSLDIQSD